MQPADYVTVKIVFTSRLTAGLLNPSAARAFYHLSLFLQERFYRFEINISGFKIAIK